MILTFNRLYLEVFKNSGRKEILVTNISLFLEQSDQSQSGFICKHHQILRDLMCEMFLITDVCQRGSEAV